MLFWLDLRWIKSNWKSLMLRTFLKDSAIYVLPTIASRGLAIFLIPLYTRVLSPADYGSLDLFMAFAGIVALTIALEVHQAVARFYQQEPDVERRRLYASSALWFSMLMNTTFALIMLALLPTVAPMVMGREGLETAFVVGLAQIWTTSVLYMVQGQLRWQLRSVQYAVVSLVMVFVSAGVSVWLTVIIGWGLVGLMLGTVAGTVFACLLALWWLRDTFRFRIDRPLLGEMLRFSAPLVVSSVAVWANLYVGRLMINQFLTIDEVGLYGIAYRVASISSLLMVAFQGALSPLIYAHYHKPETPGDLATIFKMFVVVALAACLALSSYAIDILTLLTTPDYFASAPTVALLVPAVLLGSMYIFAPGIVIAKKTHLTIWINGGGAILNVILNLVLIPTLGINGAAIAALASCILIFAVHVVIGHRYYPIPHDWSKLASVGGLAAVLALACWWLPQNGLDHRIAGFVSLVIYGIGVVGFGLVGLTEIRTGFRVTLGKLMRKLS